MYCYITVLFSPVSLLAALSFMKSSVKPYWIPYGRSPQLPHHGPVLVCPLLGTCHRDLGRQLQDHGSLPTAHAPVCQGPWKLKWWCSFSSLPTTASDFREPSCGWAHNRTQTEWSMHRREATLGLRLPTCILDWAEDGGKATPLSSLQPSPCQSSGTCRTCIAS